MNKVIYQKAKYTQTWGNSIQNNEINYRLLVDKCSAHQKKLLNLLLHFVTIYNTFITEKFPDTKDLWLIINDNQTYNYKGVDTLDDVIDYEAALEQLEQNIIYLESTIANGDKTGSAKNPINVITAAIQGGMVTQCNYANRYNYTGNSWSFNSGRLIGANVNNTSALLGKSSSGLMDEVSFKFKINDNITQGANVPHLNMYDYSSVWIGTVNMSSTLEIKFL